MPNGRSRRKSNAVRRSLDWVLDHQRITLAVAVATLVVTAALYAAIPKGFFPQQDNGLIQGVAEAAADISPTAMQAQVNRAAEIIGKTPDAAEAARWWTMAVKAGHPLAAHKLRVCLRH